MASKKKGVWGIRALQIPPTYNEREFFFFDAPPRSPVIDTKPYSFKNFHREPHEPRNMGEKDHFQLFFVLKPCSYSIK